MLLIPFISYIFGLFFFIRNNDIPSVRKQISEIAKEEADKKGFDNSKFRYYFNGEDNFEFASYDSNLRVVVDRDLKVTSRKSISPNFVVILLNLFSLVIFSIILFYTLKYKTLFSGLSFAFLAWSLTSIFADIQDFFLYAIYKMFFLEDKFIYISIVMIAGATFLKIASILDKKAFPDHISFDNSFNTNFLSSRKFVHFLVKGYLVAALIALSNLYFYNLFPNEMRIVFYSIYSLKFFGTFVSAFLTTIIGEAIFRIIPISFFFIVTKKRYSMIISIILGALAFALFYYHSNGIFSMFNLVLSLILSLSYIWYGILFSVYVMLMYSFMMLNLDVIVRVGIVNLANIALLIFFLFSKFYYWKYPLNYYLSMERPKVVLNKGIKICKEKSIILKVLSSIIPSFMIIRSIYIIFYLAFN